MSLYPTLFWLFINYSFTLFTHTWKLNKKYNMHKMGEITVIVAV